MIFLQTVRATQNTNAKNADFASHLPPFDCGKVLLARSFVCDCACKFPVSGFFCGASRCFAALRGTCRGRKKHVRLQKVKQTRPRHVQKRTLQNKAVAHRGTSRHVAAFGGASAITSNCTARIRFQAGRNSAPDLRLWDTDQSLLRQQKNQVAAVAQPFRASSVAAYLYAHRANCIFIKLHICILIHSASSSIAEMRGSAAQ